MPTNPARSAAARYGRYLRSRGADDPATLDARRDLAAENIAAAIARNVTAAPPLTPEQRLRLTGILWTGGAK